MRPRDSCQIMIIGHGTYPRQARTGKSAVLKNFSSVEYADSAGNVWGCSMYLNDERFLYGNINDNTFQEIWVGKQRQVSMTWVENSLDANSCRINCRMEKKINRYLWDLKNPPRHVNFI